MLLKTDRLLIRELTPDDWKFMQKIAADFRRSKYDMPLPIAEAEIIALTKQFAERRCSIWFCSMRRELDISVFTKITGITTWVIAFTPITRARDMPLRAAAR